MSKLFKFLIVVIVLMGLSAGVSTLGAQSLTATPVATSASTSSASGNGKLVYIDPQLVGKNSYGYTILDPVTKTSTQIKAPAGITITILALSPDGKSVAFRGYNTDDPSQTPNVYVMNVNGSNVVALTKDSNPDGKHLFRSTAPAWSPDSKQILFMHGDYISGHPIQEFQLVNADGSGSPQVIKPDSAFSFTYSLMEEAPFAAAWSSNGKRILFLGLPADNPSGTDNPVLMAMDPDGKNTTTFKQNGLFPAWSPDSKHVLAVSADLKSVTITDADGSNPQNVTLPPNVTPGNVAWSPDGTQLAFAGLDSSTNASHLYVMNVDGSNPQVVADLGSRLSYVAWGLIPASAVISGSQGTPTKTPVPSKTPIPSRTPKPSSTPKPSATPKVTATAAGPSPTPLALASLTPVVFTDSKDPASADMTADQKFVAATLNPSPVGGVVKMWDTATGAVIRTFDGGHISYVKFSPDGKYLLGEDGFVDSGKSPATIYVWDVVTGKQLYTLTDSPGSKPQFSPDSQRLVSISPFQNSTPYFKIQVSDAATGAIKASFADSAMDVAPNDVLVFLPDGKSILHLQNNGLVILDAVKGTVKAKLLWTDPKDFNPQKQAAAFSPDGKSILIGFGPVPTLYDATTLKPIRSFDMAQDPTYSISITALNFSADGKYALTYTPSDTTARLWDVQTGKLIKAFADDKYETALLTPDGKFVLLGSYTAKPLQLVSSGL